MYGVKKIENRSWEVKNLPRTIQIHTTQKTSQPWVFSDCDLPIGYIDSYRSARDSGILGIYEPFHKMVLAEKAFYGVNNFDDVPEEIRNVKNWEKWFMKEQAILGTIDVLQCIKNSYDPFSEKNCFNWVLQNPVFYDKPIMPVVGKQRLWRYI